MRLEPHDSTSTVIPPSVAWGSLESSVLDVAGGGFGSKEMNSKRKGTRSLKVAFNPEPPKMPQEPSDCDLFKEDLLACMHDPAKGFRVAARLHYTADMITTLVNIAAAQPIAKFQPALFFRN